MFQDCEMTDTAALRERLRPSGKEPAPEHGLCSLAHTSKDEAWGNPLLAVTLIALLGKCPTQHVSRYSRLASSTAHDTRAESSKFQAMNQNRGCGAPSALRGGICATRRDG